jgi:nucleoside-diphosphate-sugar epimerase
MSKLKTVLVTGGAGYVGAILVPKLLNRGYKVKVLDLYTYGTDIFDGIKNRSGLEEIKGDICDTDLLKESLPGCDAVIHLACISNDPTFELNPDLSRKVNYDAFEPLVKTSKESGVRRFIYASTCSVYGVSDAENVTEDHPLLPITDYNKYKGLCEPILWKYQSPEFTAVTIRPATVCGYSPRQRFDLTVNILTNHAYNNNHILVFGGKQERPNLHIEDMTDLYCMLLELPEEKIAGKTFNAGYQNRSVADIAEIVRKVMAEEFPERPAVTVETRHSDDIRSYRISSEKIKKELGFVPRHTIEDAVRDLIKAFKEGKFESSLENPKYFNIKLLKSMDEKKGVLI